MNCWLTKIFLLSLIISLNISCSNPSLEEYIPKNPDEKKIISLLIRYQEAKINCDLENFMVCLHDKGTFYFGRGVLLSKIELRESLPVFWDGLKSGSRQFYPINREMITGDYILTGRFYNPQIRINDESAEVVMTFMKWGWRLGHHISVVKENGQWLITKTDWETN
jgi:hypothetical protein